MELSKIARPGTKIEVILRDTKNQDDQNKQYYVSRISDVLDTGELEIYMPTEQGKMVVVQNNALLDLVFYSGRGMYTVSAWVIERYKDGGLFLLKTRVVGELKRSQRREYYRYSCNLNMLGRVMDGAERKWMEERGEMAIIEGEPLESNTVADISGGGVRFSSKHKYPEESLLYLEFDFGKQYKLCAVVLDCKEDRDTPGNYIHRAQFYGMDNSEREKLIKYIFDLELQSRKQAREKLD